MSSMPLTPLFLYCQILGLVALVSLAENLTNDMIVPLSKDVHD